MKNRISKIADGTNIDWSTAEALAFGSLLIQGKHADITPIFFELTKIQFDLKKAFDFTI